MSKIDDTKNKKGKKSMRASARSRAKYPTLQPRYNLPHRKDALECDYVNGVRGVDGDVAIRALTDSEKAWLDKFNKETVVTSFDKDGQDLYPEAEDRKKFYNENYSRFYCLYNYAKRTNNLVSFDADSYDEYVSRKIESLDCENMIVNELDRKKRKEEQIRHRKKLRLVKNRKRRKPDDL